MKILCTCMHTKSLCETMQLFLGQKFGNVRNEVEYKLQHLALDGLQSYMKQKQSTRPVTSDCCVNHQHPAPIAKVRPLITGI
jgi:hypothetical protein